VSGVRREVNHLSPTIIGYNSINSNNPSDPTYCSTVILISTLCPLGYALVKGDNNGGVFFQS
jgi:hypothetical protein